VKVIFIEDVTNVARAGDTKEVANGYGRNFLLPKKLAVLADAKSLAAVEAKLKKMAAERAKSEAEMAALAKKMTGMEITVKATAGTNEKLYGSVTSADIADGLAKGGIVVDKRKIELVEPIRQLGIHDVNVRFTHDIVATIKVKVEADKVIEGEKEVVMPSPVVEKTETPEQAEKAAAKAAKKEKKAKAKAEEKEPEKEEKKEEKAEATAEKKPEKKAKKAKEEPEAKAEKKPEKSEKKAVKEEKKAEKEEKPKAEKKTRKKKGEETPEQG
jgi:large subunit ribosomal protein L9